MNWQSISGDGELIGAGDFGAADGKDSLLFIKSGMSSDMEVVGIGDFQGDGIDDIMLWNKVTGDVLAVENGDFSNVRNAGNLDANFWEIAAVGDYNGDNKEDLLLRETVTGQGKLVYWGAGSEANWTDMKCQVGNDKFAVIA